MSSWITVPPNKFNTYLKSCKVQTIGHMPKIAKVSKSEHVTSIPRRIPTKKNFWPISSILPNSTAPTPAWSCLRGQLLRVSKNGGLAPQFIVAVLTGTLTDDADRRGPSRTINDATKHWNVLQIGNCWQIRYWASKYQISSNQGYAMPFHTKLTTDLGNIQPPLTLPVGLRSALNINWS